MITLAVALSAMAGMAIGFLACSLWSARRRHETERRLSVIETKAESDRDRYEENMRAMQERLDECKAEAARSAESMKEEFLARHERERTEWNRLKDEALADAARHHAQASEEKDRAHAEAMASLQRRFDETMEKATAQLKSATDEMLRQRQKEFSESSTSDLGQIVNPLRETIDRMKKAMDDNTVRQTAMGSEMKTSLENMMRHSDAARASAEELANALRHRGKVQGDWGETVLDELLESQGLTCGIHYDIQNVMRDASGSTVRNETGSIMRPDVILHLDTRRDVIIDSKVSLTAFMDYVNAENEDDRQKYLKAHIESIRKHVRELAAKDYSSYIQPPKTKMDYVIMFVPHSAALWTAMNAQPDLWRKSMEQNVFIADEQTLFAALKIINLTWRQIVQAQNHEQVYSLANEMIDRVGQFLKKYQALGKALENASKAYEDGEKKLQEKGQSILITCRKLEKLGAKQNPRNPLPETLEDEDLDIESMPADGETPAVRTN